MIIESEKYLKSTKELFDDNKKLALFITTWINNNLNATKAYLKLHPNVGYDSARVLGSKQLSKVNISTILSAYGLDHQIYFTQLKEGLEAKNHGEADYRTRRLYHKVLGDLLGLEQKEKEQVAVSAREYIPPSWFTPRKLE